MSPVAPMMQSYVASPSASRPSFEVDLETSLEKSGARTSGRDR